MTLLTRCDLCGKEVDRHASWSLHMEDENTTDELDYDLCVPCMRKTKKWIKYGTRRKISILDIVLAGMGITLILAGTAHAIYYFDLVSGCHY